jgi:hypothetical protein
MEIAANLGCNSRMISPTDTPRPVLASTVTVTFSHVSLLLPYDGLISRIHKLPPLCASQLLLLRT